MSLKTLEGCKNVFRITTMAGKGLGGKSLIHVIETHNMKDVVKKN